MPSTAIRLEPRWCSFTGGATRGHPDDGATGALGVRLITVDRPGAGLSDFQPGRRLLDWPKDLIALADALDIERFALLGWSGAGPHALACAHALPERVSTLGIASGFAPLERSNGARGLPLDLRLCLPLLRRAPWIARLVFARLPGQYARDSRRAFERQFGRRLPSSDQEVLAELGVRANLERGATEALRSGVRGFAYELGLLFAQPWGFEPGAVRVPTRLWYGTEDPLVPLAMGEWLAREIPGARLTVFPGEGHLLVFGHWSELLTELVTTRDSARDSTWPPHKTTTVNGGGRSR